MYARDSNLFKKYWLVFLGYKQSKLLLFVSVIPYGPTGPETKSFKKEEQQRVLCFRFRGHNVHDNTFFIKEIIGIIIIKNMNNMKCIKKNILIALLTIIISIFMFVFINIQYALVLTMSILFIEYLECI